MRITTIMIIYFFMGIMKMSSIEVPILPNDLNLPIVSLCDNHYLMMIDTGSEEAWIGDSSCKNCNKTLPLCPHISETNKQVNYFKGLVKGDYVFINSCFGKNKVICVTESRDLQNIESHGIIGVKGESTGKELMKNYLKSMNIQTNTFSFYYGLQEAKIFLGEIPQKYKKSQLPFSSSQNWTLAASKLILSSTQITQIDCQIHFDTGSTILILNTKIYEQVSKFIDLFMIENYCFQTREKLKFMCYESGINFNTDIIFQLAENKQGKGRIRLNLQRLVKIRKGRYEFQIENTDKNICVFGIPAFQGYVVQFSLDGSLKLFQSNFDVLSSRQLFNFKIVLGEYILLICAISWVLIKAQLIAKEAVDKKIVI